MICDKKGQRENLSIYIMRALYSTVHLHAPMPTFCLSSTRPSVFDDFFLFRNNSAAAEQILMK